MSDVGLQHAPRLRDTRDTATRAYKPCREHSRTWWSARKRHRIVPRPLCLLSTQGLSVAELRHKAPSCRALPPPLITALGSNARNRK